MDSSRRCAVFTLLIPLCAGIGVVYVAGLPDAAPLPAAQICGNA